MKVGDIVRQGDKIVKMKGREPSKMVGVVVEIKDTASQLPKKYDGWARFLGRSVSVLWDVGKLTENMAENSLEVITRVGSEE